MNAVAFTSFLGLVASSCSDGGSEEGPTAPGASESIGITLQPTSLELETGESGTVGITLTRSGGFEGTITLSAQGLPSGAQAGFTPASVPGGSTTSQLQLSAGMAAPGESQVVVRAAGSGVDESTATLALRIVPPAPDSSLTVDVLPFEGAILRGESAATTIQIERDNLSGTVFLSSSGLPDGVTAEIEPASTTGGEATLTLQVDVGVAEGSYTLSVTGTAAGVESHSTAVAFSVVSPPTGTGVTFSFCPSFAPSWMAYQDRDGPWTEVGAVAGADVTMPIEGRGGVAWSFASAEADYVHLLYLVYATEQELNLWGEDWCAVIEGRKEVSGTLVGLDAADAGFVGLGRAGAYVQGAQPDFTLLTVPDGPRDLVASRNRAGGAGGGGPGFPDRVILRRGLDPGHGSTLPALDFDGAEAFQPLTRQVTIGNMAGERAAASAGYWTANRTLRPLHSPSAASSEVQAFPAIPADHQESGDLHTLVVATEGVQAGNQGYARSAAIAFHEAADQSLELGPVPAFPTVTTVSADPYLRIRVRAPRQEVYGDQVMVGISTLGGLLSLTATVGYFGEEPPETWDVTVPDLTGAGYDPARGPHLMGFFATWVVSTAGWGRHPVGHFRPLEGVPSLQGQVVGVLQ